MNNDLKARLAVVKWEEFTHPCGFQSQEISSLLTELNSDHDVVSIRAANRLWDVVAHQGNVGPSSVPTLPFLLERMTTCGVQLQEELLDILYQFACAACPNNTETWAIEFRHILRLNRIHFEQLLESPSEGVTTFAENDSRPDRRNPLSAHRSYGHIITTRCTLARDRVLLNWRPSSRGLGHRQRSLNTVPIHGRDVATHGK